MVLQQRRSWREPPGFETDCLALVQRYGENDATFPGNYTFHTTSDTPDKITNKRLWLKAAKLTLATALELAR